MADVFISYSSQDKDLAGKLANELRAKGYTVWWDYEIQSGESFRAVIDQELNAARAVIVIWTENSIASKWVQAESDHAAAQAKILPVMVAGLNPLRIPKPHNTLHNDKVEDIERISAAVRRLVNRPKTFDVPVGKKVGYRSRVVAMIFAFGIAVIAVSYFYLFTDTQSKAVVRCFMTGGAMDGKQYSFVIDPVHKSAVWAGIWNSFRGGLPRRSANTYKCTNETFRLAGSRRNRLQLQPNNARIRCLSCSDPQTDGDRQMQGTRQRPLARLLQRRDSC